MIHKFAWRSRLYRKLWYWYVFRFMCPQPGKHWRKEDGW